jgi:hypothetical protein
MDLLVVVCAYIKLAVAVIIAYEIDSAGTIFQAIIHGTNGCCWLCSFDQ